MLVLNTLSAISYDIPFAVTVLFSESPYYLMIVQNVSILATTRMLEHCCEFASREYSEIYSFVLFFVSFMVISRARGTCFLELKKVLGYNMYCINLFCFVCNRVISDQ